MKRTILVASLVLALQLALTAGLWLKSDNLGAFQGGKLLALAAPQIDGLQIDGGDQGNVVLQKKDGHWRLPQHFDAPADDAKIDKLLTTLLGIERDWPVGRTAAVYKRFKVADADYQRRLEFKAGDKVLATLLIGDSPGFRKAHARLAGEKAVYDIPFSNYQASLKDGDWLDRRHLQLKPEQITAIDLPDAHLTQVDGKLQLQNLTPKEETDADHARQLLDRLTGLTVQDVVAGGDKPLPSPAVLTLSLTLKDGSQRRYDFAKGEKESQALLKVSGIPYLFSVDGVLLKDLQQTNRATLVKAKSELPKPATAKAPSAPPQG